MVCDAGKPTCEELERKVKELEKIVVIHKQAAQRMQRLNAVQEAILNIGHLIRKFADREQLIRGVCDILKRHGGYHDAGVILFDETDAVILRKETFSDNLLKSFDQIEFDKMVACCRKALRRFEPLIVHTSLLTGNGLSVSREPAGRGAMSIGLSYEAKVYGILTVSVSSRFGNEREEQELFMVKGILH